MPLRSLTHPRPAAALPAAAALLPTLPACTPGSGAPDPGGAPNSHPRTRASIVMLGYPNLFNTECSPVRPADRQMLINAGTTGLNTAIASAARGG